MESEDRMAEQDKWMNVADRVERVEVGDELVVQVEGGVIRRPAEEPGYVVGCGEESIFVPADKWIEAIPRRDESEDVALEDML